MNNIFVRNIGDNLYYTSGCGCNRRNNVNCLTSQEDCGVNVVLTSTNAVARVCDEVTYTVEITNNSNATMTRAALNLPICDALALMPGTVTVNGEAVEVENLELVPLGDIAPEETVTVVYTVTVMTCQRYIKHKAKVTFSCCQCFTRKELCVLSNVNLLQVCCCCPGTGN